MTKVQIDVVAKIYLDRILKSKQKVQELKIIRGELDQLQIIENQLLTENEKFEVLEALEKLLKSNISVESPPVSERFGYVIIQKSLNAQDNSGVLDLISALKRGVKN